MATVGAGRDVSALRNSVGRDRLSELEGSMADSIPAVRRERTIAPVHARLFGDRIFNTATFILALAILALLLGLAVALIATSFPAIRAFGLSFFISTEWDPVNDKYGALPFIYGTFISSFIALAIAVPLSLGDKR